MTTPRDIDRLSENLYHNAGKSIKDRKSFDKAFDLYLPEKTEFSERAREKVWNKLSRKFPHLRERERQTKIVQERQYKGKTLKGYAVRYGKQRQIVHIRYRDEKGRFIKRPE